MTSTKNSTAKHERYHIPNLKRGLEVFELLAKNPDGLTLPDIARLSGYSKKQHFQDFVHARRLRVCGKK